MLDYQVGHSFRKIMKLISYFSELRLINYVFLKIKTISEI
jgi:hypothetical protein